MGKFGFGSAPNIGLDILPKAIVIADRFAPGANGNNAPQGFYLLGGRFKNIRSRNPQHATPILTPGTSFVPVV